MRPSFVIKSKNNKSKPTNPTIRYEPDKTRSKIIQTQSDLKDFMITNTKLPLDYSNYQLNQPKKSNVINEQNHSVMNDSLTELSFRSRRNKTEIKDENPENIENSLEIKNENSEFEDLINSIEKYENLNDDILNGEVKIIKYLTEGSQAKIYLGLIKSLDQMVAIKRYDVYNFEQVLVERIQIENEIMMELDHPNIIKYYAIDFNFDKTSSGFIDIVLEYIPGYNLKEYLKKYGKLNSSQIKQIIVKIISGLDYLHSNKIIHRDLKPENILVDDTLEVLKITDFGICKKINENETLKKRSCLGTPWYMAPEVVMEKPYNYEVDIWSLGCVLFELITEVKPYNDMNYINALTKMTEYSNPLEHADDWIKDIFYDKENRRLLEFVLLCWRSNPLSRPTASDLLKHKYLEE